MNFKVILNSAKLVLKKNAPTIAIVGGIVAGVAATVTTAVVTTKLSNVQHKNRQLIADAKELKPVVSDKEYRKELTVAYVKSAGNIAALYWPSVTLTAASITCILVGHNILRKRNLVLAAAVTSLTQEFKSYREKIVEEFGEEADHKIMESISSNQVITMDEDGTVTETREPNGTSIYSKFFDEYNDNWSKSSDDNLLFLKCQENTANQLLHARGHLFLNEVYDMLGFDRTKYGAVCGWVIGNGDDCVDFGIFDKESDAARSFVNGQERSILLNFNVDGVIYDLL